MRGATLGPTGAPPGDRSVLKGAGWMEERGSGQRCYHLSLMERV